MAQTQLRGTYAAPSTVTLNSSYIDTTNSEVVCTSLGGVAFLSGRIKITGNLSYNTQIASSILQSRASNAWVLLVGYTTHNTYLTRVTSSGTWLAVDPMAKATDEIYNIVSTCYQRNV